MKNISQSEIKSSSVEIHGLPEDVRLSQKDRVVPSIACIGTCWADHRCSVAGQETLFLDFRTVCSKHSKM